MSNSRNHPNIQGFYTVAEASNFLGLTPKQIYRRVKLGRIEHFNYDGSIVFTREHLERYRNACFVRSDSTKVSV